MTDPLAVANLALSLAGKTTEALSALRERAQRSKDLDLKDRISSLYNYVLDLKEVVQRLVDENKALQRQIEKQRHPPEKPKIRTVGDTNYYFLGDEGRYCQPCYLKTEKLVLLLPSESHEGGIRRECPVCHGFFYEKKMQLTSDTWFGRGGGPQGWMR